MNALVVPQVQLLESVTSCPWLEQVGSDWEIGHLRDNSLQVRRREHGRYDFYHAAVREALLSDFVKLSRKLCFVVERSDAAVTLELYMWKGKKANLIITLTPMHTFMLTFSSGCQYRQEHPMLGFFKDVLEFLRTNVVKTCLKRT